VNAFIGDRLVEQSTFSRICFSCGTQCYGYQCDECRRKNKYTKVNMMIRKRRRAYEKNNYSSFL